MTDAVVPAIRGEKRWIRSFDPFFYIDLLFHISMVWFAAVIIIRSFRLASSNAR